MTVSLNPELEKRIAQEVARGQVDSAETLVRKAVEGYLDGAAHGEHANLASEFRACVEKWRAETGHFSSIERKALHPAYQRIIAMGRPAIPLVLRELQEHGGHWFWALSFMEGESPVPEGASIQGAKDAWLSWGRQKGYL